MYLFTVLVDQDFIRNSKAGDYGNGGFRAGRRGRVMLVRARSLRRRIPRKR